MRWACVGLVVGCLFGVGCAPEEQGGKPKVVCTTGMVADLARAIAGDRVRVIQLLPNSVDPHLYQAAPQDIRELYGADLVLYSGLHLEGRMATVLHRMEKLRPTVAVTSQLSRDQLLPPAEPGADEHSEEMVDPHVWMDVARWSEGIAVVRDALVGIDPEGKAEYHANAERYAQQLAELDAECRRELAKIPRGHRTLVTAHDAFGYFADAYGLEVRAIQGLSTESEASVRDINQRVHFLVDRKIPAVFIEASLHDRNVRALIEGCAANGHTVRIGGELFSDTLGEPGSGAEDYISMIRHNVRTIAGALQ